MKLKTKLLLAFGFITILLVSISLGTRYYNNRLKNQVIDRAQQVIADLDHTEEMGIYLYQSMLNAQYYLDERNPDNSEDGRNRADVSVSKAREGLIYSLNIFDQNLTRISQSVDTTGAAGDNTLIQTLQKLRMRFEIYRSLVNQLLTLSDENYADSNEFFNVTIEPYFRSNLVPLIERFRELSQLKLDRETRDLNTRLVRADTILIVTIAVIFFVSLGMIFYIYQSIAEPLNRLSLGARHIGEGNLEERIEINSNDEIGHLVDEFNQMAANLSNKTVSKQYVDNIIESMGDALIVTGPEGAIEKVNNAAQEMLGYRDDELVGQKVNDLCIETDLEEGIAEDERILRVKDGGDILVKLTTSALGGEDAETGKGTVYLARDITRQKEQEEQIRKSLREKEILLGEIHHRVKNNLAVISGILQMQMWETEEESIRLALTDSQLRVESIALVHELLYQTDSLSSINMEEYVRDLLKAITDTLLQDTKNNIHIETNLPELELTLSQAIPCALLLNELIMNAHKHAFNGTEQGRIAVNMERDAETIVCRVCDNGKGLPDDFSLNDSEHSMGMSLVQTLVKQLDGKIKTYNDDGAVFEFSFDRQRII